jgi:hypothetical protein
MFGSSFSPFLRMFTGVFSQMLPLVNGEMIFVSAAKGIENDTLIRMSEIVKDVTKPDSRHELLLSPDRRSRPRLRVANLRL